MVIRLVGITVSRGHVVTNGKGSQKGWAEIRAKWVVAQVGEGAGGNQVSGSCTNAPKPLELGKKLMGQ